MLKSQRSYGWITGRNEAGEQVLVADTVSVLFDEAGHLNRFQDEDASDWEVRAGELISREEGIQILRKLTDSGGEDRIFLLGDRFWLNPDGTVESH